MDIHIVDDDDSIQAVFTAIADDMGFKAQSFFSAEEYLSYVASENYAAPKLVLLTDLYMSAMSGDELICEIRKIKPEQKFILATGNPEDVILKEERLCFYLTKPVDMTRLQSVFKTLFECTKHGPDVFCANSNCASFSDLGKFNIDDWRCPHKGEQLH